MTLLAQLTPQSPGSGPFAGSPSVSGNVVTFPEGSFSVYRFGGVPGAVDAADLRDGTLTAVLDQGALDPSESSFLELWDNAGVQLVRVQFTTDGRVNAYQGNAFAADLGPLLGPYVRLTVSGTGAAGTTVTVATSTSPTFGAGYAVPIGTTHQPTTGIDRGAAYFESDGPATMTILPAASGALITPNAPELVYSPYTWHVMAGVAITQDTGARMRTRFTGANCTLRFDAAGLSTPKSLAKAHVDGGAWQEFALAASVVLTVPALEPSGGHTLELVFRGQDLFSNSWDGVTTALRFLGLTLDVGATVAAIVPESRRLLVYGDSITQGVQSLGANGAVVTNHDATRSYAYLAAATLGMDIGLVAFAGTGVDNPAGNVPSWYDAWDDLYGGGPIRSFAPAPTAIVINLGTNDTNNTDILPHFVAVLNFLLAGTPAATRILVLRPFNGEQQARVLAATQQCSTPARVTYVDTTSWLTDPTAQTWDGVHPTATAHRDVLAPRLVQAVNAVLGPTPVIRVRDGASVIPAGGTVTLGRQAGATGVATRTLTLDNSAPGNAPLADPVVALVGGGGWLSELAEPNPDGTLTVTLSAPNPASVPSPADPDITVRITATGATARTFVVSGAVAPPAGTAPVTGPGVGGIGTLDRWAARHQGVLILSTAPAAAGALVGRSLLDAGPLAVPGAYECLIPTSGLKELDVHVRPSAAAGAVACGLDLLFASRGAVRAATEGADLAAGVLQTLQRLDVRGAGYCRFRFTVPAGGSVAFVSGGTPPTVAEFNGV